MIVSAPFSKSLFAPEAWEEEPCALTSWGGAPSDGSEREVGGSAVAPSALSVALSGPSAMASMPSVTLSAPSWTASTLSATVSAPSAPTSAPSGTLSPSSGTASAPSRTSSGADSVTGAAKTEVCGDLLLTRRWRRRLLVPSRRLIFSHLRRFALAGDFTHRLGSEKVGSFHFNRPESHRTQNRSELLA